MLTINKHSVFLKHQYWLCMLLILTSGSPFFRLYEYIYVIGSILICVWLLAKGNTKKVEPLLPYLFGILLIFIAQTIFLGWISLPGVINYISKTFMGSMIILLLGYNFRNYYFIIMYHLSVIALLLFGFFLITDIAFDLFPSITSHHNIIFYNMRISEMVSPRNCGPFWEPGAYACYLLLVPILFVNDIQKLWKFHKYKCILLLIALLSTQSTTGYIAFGIFIFLFILFKTKVWIKIILLPLSLFIASYIYFNLDFLYEKITLQTESSLEAKGDYNSSRLGSLIFDWHYIKKHPLIGNGLHENTRYADHLYLIQMLKGDDRSVSFSGNGFSGQLVSMGLFFYFMFFYFFIKRNKRTLTRKDFVIICIMYIVLLQGEPLFNYPLFLGLPFCLIPKLS